MHLHLPASGSNPSCTHQLSRDRLLHDRVPIPSSQTRLSTLDQEPSRDPSNALSAPPTDVASSAHRLSMPSFFQFTQGTESRVRPNDTSPLLGRFRAVPPRSDLGPRRPSSLGLLAGTLGNGRGSVHVGYGALIAAELGNDAQSTASDDDFEDDRSYGQRLWQRWIVDLWVDPRQSAVKRVLEKWWSRYGFLVLLPALLVRIPTPYK